MKTESPAADRDIATRSGSDGPSRRSGSRGYRSTAQAQRQKRRSIFAIKTAIDALAPLCLRSSKPLRVALCTFVARFAHCGQAARAQVNARLFPIARPQFSTINYLFPFKPLRGTDCVPRFTSPAPQERQFSSNRSVGRRKPQRGALRRFRFNRFTVAKYRSRRSFHHDPAREFCFAKSAEEGEKVRHRFRTLI